MHRKQLADQWMERIESFLGIPKHEIGKIGQGRSHIGRVQRSEIPPVIYDYRDIRIDYLNKMFLKRNIFYRKLEKEATLFDEPEDEIAPSGSFLSPFFRITFVHD